jgi:hypothetical protein
MDQVKSVNDKIDLLATKNWVAEELSRRDARLDQLAIAMTAASARSRLKAAADAAQQIGTLVAWVAAVAALMAAAVHFWDGLPK